jgi:uncharacterized protein (TIGR03435 family)
VRTFTSISLIALLSGLASGQSTDALPAFDLADVHGSAKVANPYMRGGLLRAGRYEVRTASMVDLIAAAYGVDADKVLGGPQWVATERFDIIAKAPPTTPPETVKLMLQTLLADRFKLVLHKDTKTFQSFALMPGKGKTKMKEASGPGNGCQGVPQTPAPGEIPYSVVACHGITMAAFAPLLRQMAPAYATNPVMDKTGLEGYWDLEIKWTGRGQLVNAGSAGITLFDAIDKQLGLKLEPQQLPTPVLVVDSVNQKPTDNLPGVTTSLPPPPPAEFEVADIRPSLPGATQGGKGLQPGGLLDLRGFPLKMLIQIAWNINSDDLIAGPKFMETASFDIIAKASSTTSGTGNNMQVDEDALRLMFRALLEDRFKMKTHMEDRPVSTYVLTAVKPKLQKADPSNRTECKEGPGADGKDPRIANPVLVRLISCQNMTMAQFAQELPKRAGGYVQTAILDATGLTGAWDFSVNFSPIGAIRAGGDPNGALSLSDAISKQLGLKLEMQKRPTPVLVIDHVEEKPTDN